MLGLGALAAVSLMEMIILGDFFWVRDLLLLRDSRWHSDTEFWGLLLHRMALICVPIGLACYESAKRVRLDSSSSATANVVDAT